MSPRTYIRRKKLEHVRHPDDRPCVASVTAVALDLRLYLPIAELYVELRHPALGRALPVRLPGRRRRRRWSVRRARGAATPARPAATQRTTTPAHRGRHAFGGVQPAACHNSAAARLHGMPQPATESGIAIASSTQGDQRRRLAGGRGEPAHACTATPRRSWPRSAAGRAAWRSSTARPERPGGAGQPAQGRPVRPASAAAMRASTASTAYAHPRQSPEVDGVAHVLAQIPAVGAASTLCDHHSAAGP